MSSLTSLKNDIRASTDELVTQAIVLSELDAQVHSQTKKVTILKEHIARLSKALAIIEGTDSMQEPEVRATPTPPPSASPGPAPNPRKAQLGPPCSACGEGIMLPATKRVPTGAYVNILLCSDPNCNNEAM